MDFIRQKRRAQPLSPSKTRSNAQALSVNQHRKIKVTLSKSPWDKEQKEGGKG
jgi:hypothetical protein